MNDTVSIIILAACVVASAYFSATETAFTSLNTIRMRNLAEQEGHRRAQLVLRLSEDFDSVLSTILIGNNVVNILFTSIMTVLFVNALGDQKGASMSTLISTLIILIFAEISPKSIVKERPEGFALFAAPGLSVLMKVLKPFTFIFGKWKQLLSHLFRSQPNDIISEAEFMTILDEVEEQGTINTEEGEFIRRAVEFTEIPADAVMTPRTDVVALPVTAGDDEIREAFSETGYSRIPIYEEDIDHIIGVIHVKKYLEDDDHRIRDVLEPCLFVPENSKINRLLRRMQQKKFHLAVVLDEYGGTAGIITLEDILEELIGEIWDESDEVEEEIVRIGDMEFQCAGGLSIEKFFRIMNIEDETSSSTLSGWLIEKLDAFPEVGDVWENDEIYAEVTAVERHRITSVYIRRKVV